MEVLAGSACFEVLAVSAESIIMISESGIGAEDNTLRGVFAGEHELEEHELEEDVIEDIFVVDGELIIHIFTGEIFSYLCTFFHSLYTCPFSRRCENYCHRCLSNLRGREVAPASFNVLAAGEKNQVIRYRSTAISVVIQSVSEYTDEYLRLEPRSHGPGPRIHH